MFNNLERVHQRAAKRNPGIGPLSSFRAQTITRHYQLTSLQEASGQTVDFPAGVLIVSVGMDAAKAAVGAATVRGDLSMVRLGVDLPSADGTLTAGGPVMASCLFGRDGTRQWPEQEVAMPKQGAVSLTLINLTTDTIDVDIAFNVLFPRNAAA